MTIPVSDPGLQPERTSLSWQRTALAMLVCSATLLRWSGHYPGVVFGAIGLLAVLSLVITVTQRKRYAREAQGLAEEVVPPNVNAVLAMTIAMTTLGAIGLYLVSVTL
ncbi:DUF202 domain-containing protein [Corynebacterium breve]|uniref:DUF202 domain-containing protein n=1 Tax=Corynebacterium breve TaxID=3049799 RepID=A0ABY8VFT9_9CORY|nr:DUF202 domain-containing protein [Corynebacterium breve]WIM67630.1 DUF202 domain-containing protein [Corynebacterium breve]